MQLQELVSLRQEAVLDSDKGRLTQAEAQLSDIVVQLRNHFPDNRAELCRTLVDRAQVLTFANRWEEALKDLSECAAIGPQLKLLQRMSILVNVYEAQARLYGNPLASVFNLDAARHAISNLESLGYKGWILCYARAELAYRERDWRAALNGYRQVSEQLAADAWIRGAAACQLKTGRALLELNQLDAAADDLTKALKFFQRHGPPDSLAATKIHLARLRAAQGDVDEAWQLAESALDLIESAIRKFGALFDQQRFVLDKLTNYEYAFAIALAKRGDEGVWRAWSIAERAKSFYLCQLVANADVNLFAGVDPTQLAKLRELEAELDRLEATMKDLPSGGNELQARFNEASKAKEKLHAELMRANPRWGLLKKPPRLDLPTELKKLDPKWTPLSYFWQESHEGATLHIFSTTSDRRPLHVTVAWSQTEIEKLDQLQEKLRGRVMPILKVFPRELVEKTLPRKLLDQLGADQRLLISPHGRLRMLPLHAAPVGDEKRLIDLCTVQYIPTLALLPFRRADKRAEKILLMGCEQDGFKNRPLKHVPQELNELEQVWAKTNGGKTEKFLLASNGSPSGSGAPVNRWSNYDVLHLSCHGEFPEGRPFDTGLYLGNDIVRMSEFFGVRLNARIVCLSACSLARQTREHSGLKLAGDEWVGLYLPLFYSGARGVLASLWDAYSEDAAPFMAEMHRGFAEGLELGESFQLATQSRYRRPEPTWANWYLVGFPE